MIGKILKYMRTDKQLSQEDLSNILNINQTTLSGWERGYREPTFKSIETIAKICDFNIIFENKKTKERISAKNIERKEI